MPPCRLIPVLDLQGNLVVRGVGGRRHEYRPIVSRLTSSARPFDVAKAFMDAFHPSELYLADLDAIAGAPPSWSIYRELQTLGVSLWVDAGIREADDAALLADAGIDGIVCGLESLSGPAALEAIVRAIDPSKVVFSLDMHDGRLLGARQMWDVKENDPLALVKRVKEIGVQRLIVLDLANVGENRGIGTIDFCRRIRMTDHMGTLVTGGGIRDAADFETLSAIGVDGALVASALHDGRLLASNPSNR